MYFIDIETVSKYKDFFDAPEQERKLFEKKMKLELDNLGVKEGEDPTLFLAKLYEKKASVLAEFNRIVCVSLGTIIDQTPTSDSSQSIYIKSFTGTEKEILMTLSSALSKAYSLCAHFGKGFDYPVLARKYVIYQIPIPNVLNISGLKPWEIPLIDTQESWKFGDMRHSVSLDTLAYLFGLPSPKQDMDGSQVSKVFWNEGEAGLKKIVTYCEADVRTLANVYRVMNYQPVIQ